MAIERSVINRCYAKNSESSTGGYYLSRPEPGGSDPLDEQCGDLIYQMVHRAASAAEAGSSLSLAYLLFEPSPRLQTATPGEMLDKLTQLWETLDSPASFDFHVLQIEATPTRPYEPLAQLPRGDEATAEAVSEAFQGGAPAVHVRTSHSPCCRSLSMAPTAPDYSENAMVERPANEPFVRTALMPLWPMSTGGAS
jgi:hypothetical protein